MNEKEVNDLIKSYGISTRQLPKIHDSDLVVKAVGAKAGDIIKIVRKSPTAGETNYYRLVVKG